jgi:hypothetical protein
MKNCFETPGVTTPEILLRKQLPSMHMEDTDVCSLNYMVDLVGEGKLWLTYILVTCFFFQENRLGTFRHKMFCLNIVIFF